MVVDNTLITEYSATVTYEYEVAGVKYSGKFYDAMSNDPVFSTDKDGVDRMGKEYVGKIVPIFYETKNVGNSTVHVDKNSSVMYFIISGVLLFVALIAKFAQLVPTPYVAPIIQPQFTSEYVSVTV